MGIAIWLELLVVIGAIVMGVRMGGMGLGIWGVAGVGVLVYGFGLAPGDPPIAAILIILAVITAAAAMQAAGGIDYLVRLATAIIRKNPKQITIIAPLVSYVFTVGAGTSNIFYPLIPVIYEVSYQNDIRPERPLAVSTVANALGITSSPVSAAMAAMLTLVVVKGMTLPKILLITIPASIVAILVTAFVQNFIGKPLSEDPVYQQRLKDGLVEPPKPVTTEKEEPLKKGAALSAYIFLAGVVMIVATGAIPALQRMVPAGENGALIAVDSTTAIQIIMFVVALLILLFCQAKVEDIAKQQVFGAGIIALLALFGIAWLADTFVSANQVLINATLQNAVTAVPVAFALAIFILAALTTSQSATTRTLVPIALGIPVLGLGAIVAMWQAVSGVLFLPANGTQLAAVNVDQTGTTKIGKAVVNHSFMIPLLVCTVVAVGVGMVLGLFVHEPHSTEEPAWRPKRFRARWRR
jgi:anaerobic C4-dicarboxylate transporter DcuA/anaerobic C4-dicarboxylate transporter DcuB